MGSFQQERLRNDDDGIDISTGSDFHGLMTFANLPYANCFKDDTHDGDVLESDIFLLGAPFDTVSLPNQPRSLRDRRSTDCSFEKKTSREYWQEELVGLDH